MPFAVTRHYRIYETEEAAASAAKEIADGLKAQGVDPNNLVFQMGQYHDNGPSEMMQTHFVNALQGEFPFQHFCAELQDKYYQNVQDNFVVRKDAKLYDEAERYAQQLGTYKARLGDIEFERAGQLVPCFSVVNALQHDMKVHFIDLPCTQPDPYSSSIDAPPDKKYRERFGKRRNYLGEFLYNHGDMFETIGAHAWDGYGMTQRDLQMLGRIDDVLRLKEGPVMANCGLAHVHDPRSNRLTLADLLLFAGRDLVTIAFHPGNGKAETDATFDAFCKRRDEVQGMYAVHGLQKQYKAYATMKMLAAA